MRSPGEAKVKNKSYGHALRYAYPLAGGVGLQSGVSVINPAAASMVDMLFVGHLLH